MSSGPKECVITERNIDVIEAVLQKARSCENSMAMASLIEGIARLTGKPPTAHCFQGLTWSLYQYGRTVSAHQFNADEVSGTHNMVKLWRDDLFESDHLRRPQVKSVVGELGIGFFKGYTDAWRPGRGAPAPWADWHIRPHD